MKFSIATQVISRYNFMHVSYEHALSSTFLLQLFSVLSYYIYAHSVCVCVCVVCVHVCMCVCVCVCVCVLCVCM